MCRAAMGTYCTDAGNIAYAVLAVCFMAVLFGTALVRELRQRRGT